MSVPNDVTFPCAAVVNVPTRDEPVIIPLDVIAPVTSSATDGDEFNIPTLSFPASTYSACVFPLLSARKS